MNSRERLFFKDVKLHRSMSFQKRLDKEEIDLKRKQFKEEYLKRKAEKKKKSANVLSQSVFCKIFG